MRNYLLRTSPPEKSFVIFCLFFLAFLMPDTLWSQKNCYIYLKIVDTNSAKPLDEASLKIDGEDSGILSDSSGILRMPVTCEEHSVRVQKLGYRPFTRRITAAPAAEPLIVVLENIKNQIEEVVVTSQGSVRTHDTPALGVSQLSMKAVKRITPAAGEVDILRSLQSLPGISAVGEGANGINIRGGAVDQNLIMLDHMPIYNPTHLLGLFSLFPTDAIREMQVYKGSIPARFAGKTAGVLDVKLSEPDLENRRFSGGIGLISNRMHLETPIIKEKVALMSSLRVSYTDPLIRLYNNRLVGTFSEKRLPNARPIFYDLANKILWRPSPKDYISVVSYLSYDSYRVDNLFSIAGITPSQSTMEYGHRNTAARWNHFFNDQWNLNVHLIRTDYFTRTSASEPTAGFQYDTRLLHHIAKAEATWIPSKSHRVSGGIAVNRYDNQPATLVPRQQSVISSVTIPKEQAWETGIYISDEYELNSRLLVDVGARWVNYWNMGPYAQSIYDPNEPRTPSSVIDTVLVGKNKKEAYYGRFEPRFGLRYRIDENRSVKIGYNRMNQFLQMVANNATPLPNVRWKTAGRNLVPNQSDLFSLGYFHDGSKRIWEWSAELYYRHQNAIFDFVNGAELNINPLIETQLLKGKARAYGAELFINKKKGTMTGWMSYTYARSFQRITGDFPAIQSINDGNWFRSNIDKPHTVNTMISFQGDKYNAASFTFTYSTGRPYTSPSGFFNNGSGFVPIFTERNNARISDYHRLDFSWTIRNPSMKERRWESSWVVAFYNLYGRKNAFSYFFNPNAGVFKPYKISVFPTPIFSITWNIEFK